MAQGSPQHPFETQPEGINTLHAFVTAYAA
jgi:hypothetical protein